MKNQWRLIVRVAILACALAMAACGAGATTTGTGNTPKPTATTAPTATPKPKPTSPPPVTLAFCQSVLTVDQANQIMQPATPATMITVTPETTDTDFSLCTYESQNPVPVLVIGFQGYSGPIPIPTSEFAALTSQLEQSLGAEGGSITTQTIVTGVGDQAAFIALNAPTPQFTIYTDILYVLYGKVLFDCAVYNLGSLPPDATEQSALQQCAQHVISAL